MTKQEKDPFFTNICIDCGKSFKTLAKCIKRCPNCQPKPPSDYIMYEEGF